MKRMRVCVVIALIGSLLGGCAGQYGEKQAGGAVIGGVLGGLLGSHIGGGGGRLAATAGLAVLGLVLGSEAGRSLDRADAVYVQNTTQRALESNPVGQPMVWQNQERQVYTQVVPTRTYQTNGRYCREYQQDITIGGKTERSYGRACRQPDGTWQIVNDQSSNADPVIIQRQTVVQQQPTVIYRYYDEPAPVMFVPNYSVGYQERLRWEHRHGYRHWH